VSMVVLTGWLEADNRPIAGTRYPTPTVLPYAMRMPQKGEDCASPLLLVVGCCQLHPIRTVTNQRGGIERTKRQIAR
jgi:hypothetical protein